MILSLLRKGAALIAALVTSVTIVQASTDYAPAIWRPAYKNHWYKTGNGHKFVVIHDMEGYYWATITYFQQSGTQASVHYCVNGKKDAATDSVAGELTQMVLEANYAWHALCWNTHSLGTEHEGFVSNPAWYTYEMYKTSADLQRHMLDKFAIARDRNHVVGHNEWQNSAWVAWASGGLGIDPTCNTHTDPGAYWDWNYFMSLINATPVNRSEVVGISAPSNVDAGAAFTASVTFRNTGNTTWQPGTYFLGSQNPQDNTRWGTNRVTLSAAVAPGATNTTTFTCTAPATGAIYPFEWKLLQEGVEWFGQTAATTINVGNAQAVADIIIDNPQATVVGTWSTGTGAADKYGADYRFHSQGGGNYLQYTPNIQTAGNYNVYEWHSIGSNRTVGAPLVIDYNGGSTTVNVNQQVSGGQWNLIGTFNFVTGSVGSVKITDGFADAGQVVIADAIKFVYVP